MSVKNIFVGAIRALKIRKRILTGIITIVPISVTIWVLYILGVNVHKIFRPFIVKFTGIESAFIGTVISVLLMFICIYVIGFMSAFLAIRRTILLGEGILARIPFIKVIYGSLKQVMDALTLTKRSAFKKVVVIEYPRRGSHALGFVSGELITGDKRERMVSIFMPTTPNPTTGFLFLIPEREVRETNLSVSEGMRILLSGGILFPDELPVREYRAGVEAEEGDGEEREREDLDGG